jgi:FkbM family methyltransferase
MKFMENKNEAALALRKLYQHKANTTIDKAQFESLMEKTSYFGFVDIEIDDILFSMFSNNDDFVARTYFWNGKNAYESTSLKLWTALAKLSSHVIDIGSYTGVYSLAAAKSNPKSKVFAIEALDRVYSRLLANKRANGASNLKCFNVAITDGSPEVELFIYSGEDILVSGSTTVAEVTDRSPVESRIVRATSLDNFVQDHNIPRIELLKIDAEGAEHLILSSAQGIIEKSKPDIICELLPTSVTESIHASLKPYGYRYYRISESSLILTESRTPPASIEPPDFNILMTTMSASELEHALPFLTFEHLA